MLFNPTGSCPRAQHQGVGGGGGRDLQELLHKDGPLQTKGKLSGRKKCGSSYDESTLIKIETNKNAQLTNEINVLFPLEIRNFIQKNWQNVDKTKGR